MKTIHLPQHTYLRSRSRRHTPMVRPAPVQRQAIPRCPLRPIAAPMRNFLPASSWTALRFYAKATKAQPKKKASTSTPKKKKGTGTVVHHRRSRAPLVPVILTQDMMPIGQKGEEIQVKRGFARNFLFARGLAVHANEDTRAQYAEDAKKIDYEARERKRISDKARKRISKLIVRMKRHEVSPGVMFAPVSKENIIEKLFKQHKLELSPEEIILDAPITKYGEHKITVRTGDTESQFTVNIERR